MAYLKDFYPFDIDDSVQNTMYVFSEMKYEHSDILLLAPDSITKWKGRFALTFVQINEAAAILKALQK